MVARLGLPVLLAAACSFDSSGLMTTTRRDAAVDLPRDVAISDIASPDQRPDQAVDFLVDAPPDQAPTVDAPPAVELTAADVEAAFTGERVPCIKADGTSDGTDIPLTDDPAVTISKGSSLALPQQTLNWIGRQSAVLVRWNPNACDDEMPNHVAEQWETAGLLIRGATFCGDDCMVLPVGTATEDINLIDVSPMGSFQSDTFFPDDSGLTAFPQLVETVNRAKSLIVELATPQ